MQTQATQASPALASASQSQPLQAHATALLRVSLGVMALAHGLLKVFVFTVPGTVGYFESIGLPALIAYLTILAEVGGGLALILGIYSRWVSLALIPVLIGAAWVHAGNGWVFSNPGGGWEYPVFWAVALLVQAGLGSGSLVVSRRFA
ncbi:DoxX family protein [Halomonas sp. MCCC 1A17488]|uniref:DoxX family protein n=1 Tax=unclassified Halomonas TaxID=2609666 RepID=UPI0018D1FE8F|nr:MULTISPECIES: DoxX family protein [unclassified Halomonas]MCE8016941.1 DoxX family protein [Halomonas sp. MCCC 1A17488]MCG3240274.1 DoxX family protein [Halomonas sp. MCCC 1A17488]QPP49852.1 DoxX family protein [Halomonas sp. SS10-MC5]